jgi:hypothetical protein
LLIFFFKGSLKYLTDGDKMTQKDNADHAFIIQLQQVLKEAMGAAARA